MKTTYTIAILSLIIIGCAANLQGTAQKETFQVMTCNTGDLSSRKRISTRELAAFLKSCAPADIMLLQEIRGEGEAKKIAQELEMKHYLFLKDRGKKAGIAIVSRWPLLNPDHIYFKESSRGFGALSADIVLKDVTIQLVNVHLDRDNRAQSKNGNVEFDMVFAWQFVKDEMTKETVRSRSAQALTEWLKTKGADNIILGGDFNTIPQSKSIHIMETMFDDALCPSLSCFQGTYKRLNAPFPLRIDYLFHTPSLQRLDASIIHKSAGDHYPVVAQFSLPHPPTPSP